MKIEFNKLEVSNIVYILDIEGEVKDIAIEVGKKDGFEAYLSPSGYLTINIPSR